ncbi:MAG: hypothetical protein ABR577_06845 [Pyrinomonadaceae bacterium]
MGQSRLVTQTALTHLFLREQKRTVGVSTAKAEKLEKEETAMNKTTLQSCLAIGLAILTATVSA